jgi:hypothetical protein
VGIWHTVQQGECVWSLGRKYKIPWKRIWNDSENEPLRSRRGNPNVLSPGDRVFIPDKTRKQESCPTEQRQKFILSEGLSARVAIQNLYHEPLPDIEYHFVIDGEPQSIKKTGADGVAEQRLPKSVQSLVLVLPWGDLPVELGMLDPANTVRGAQQRLKNLGLDPGTLSGTVDEDTARAIREFQEIESEHLEVSGKLDRKTIRRLREKHDGEVLQAQEELESNTEQLGTERTQDSVSESAADEMEDPAEEIPYDIAELWDVVDPDLIDVFQSDALDQSE